MVSRSRGAHATTVAPYPSVASRFTREEPSGMTTVTGTPRILPASASAWPWLPLEWVITPAARAAESSRLSAL